MLATSIFPDDAILSWHDRFAAPNAGCVGWRVCPATETEQGSEAPVITEIFHRSAPVWRSGNYHARILGASGLWSQNASVRKTIYSKQSEYLCEMLVAMRKRAGVTQRQLAE